jgi:hypothetical protein
MAESPDVNQLIKDEDRVDGALRQAAAAARRQYVAAELEMPVWRDGRLAWLTVQALEAGEYGASVVAAVARLETELTRRLGRPTADQMRGEPEPMRSASVASLVAAARDSGMLRDLDMANLTAWTQLRNEIVHRGRLTTEGEAREIVAGIEALLRQLLPNPQRLPS